MKRLFFASLFLYGLFIHFGSCFGVYFLSSPSLLPDSISFCILLRASLNSLMPRPIPRANSGIFLPPKSNSATKKMIIHSEPPGRPMMYWFYRMKKIGVSSIVWHFWVQRYIKKMVF